MPEATDATLTSLVEHGPIKSLRIEALRETSDARYLGVVGVSYRHPIFHVIDMFPFSGELSPDSRFILRRLFRAGHETMVFVLFRQFESSKEQAFPEDLVAGWVPIEEEEQALRWAERMNGQIRGFGVTDDVEPPAPVAAPQQPTGAEPGTVIQSFAVRTRFAGTAQELVEHLERRLGVPFRAVDGPGYDALPAFGADGLGMTIRLMEFPPVASYPRRFTLTGVTERRLGVDYPETRDVTGDILERLANDGMAWYVPTREELDTEAGF